MNIQLKKVEGLQEQKRKPLIVSKSLLLIFTVCLLSFCQKQKNYTSLVRYVTCEKHCIVSFKGDTDCLKFNNKKIFILPYLDTLITYQFLYDLKQKKQMPDSVLWQVEAKIDSSYRQPIYFDTANLKLNLVMDRSKADMFISFTPNFFLNNQKYCIVQIKEKYKMWYLKIRINQNDKYSSELNLFLD